MKNDKNLSRIVSDHERRISHLESLLSEPQLSVPSRKKRTLNDHIIDLRDKGFFSQPKSGVETYTKLKDSYSCERNRVDVALLRLSERRKLRLTSRVVEGKKYKAYVW